jgi:hypothetical protein
MLASTLKHYTTLPSKNAVFWDVTPCGSYKNRRFGGKHRLHQEDHKNRRASQFAISCRLHVGGDVLPKRLFLQELHGVTSQKTAFFVVTSVKTSAFTGWALQRRCNVSCQVGTGILYPRRRHSSEPPLLTPQIFQPYRQLQPISIPEISQLFSGTRPSVFRPRLG